MAKKINFSKNLKQEIDNNVNIEQKQNNVNINGFIIKTRY